MIDDDENNFPHKLFLTNRQVVNLCKAFADKSSNDIKLSKTQTSKMVQSGAFLGRLLGPFLKTGLPLMKNISKPLAKNVLIPLGLTAAASAAGAGIYKKIIGSGHHPYSFASHNCPSSSALHNNTILMTSSDEMKPTIKIVKSLEYSSLLPEGVSETKMKLKNKEEDFLVCY